MEKRKRNISHRDVFLADNPDMMPLVGSEFEDLLRAAAAKKFVAFVVFQGEEFYTEFDLRIAKIWQAKKVLATEEDD